MSTFLNQTHKKILAGVFIGLLLSISGSAIFLPTPKAEAQISGCAAAFAQAIGTAIGQATFVAPFSIPVAANGQIFSQSEVSGSSLQDFITNCIEHEIALAAAKYLLSLMTQEIVQYISSGFRGNPAFVTNPGRFFKNFGLGIAADFITHFLGNICLDFQLEVGASLAFSFENVNIFTNSPQDTGQAAQCPDLNGFDNDFNNGGWEAWFSALQGDNNPYAAYLDAQNNLDSKIANTQANESLKIQFGAGFLSQETCTDDNGNTVPSLSELDPNNTGDQAILDEYDSDQVTCNITTPGQTISGVLQNQLNIPADQLGVADDLDKIFNALGNQLLQAGLASIGLNPNGGLIGASAGAHGATSLLALLTQDAQTNQQQANATGINQLNQTTGGIPTGPGTPTNVAQGKQATQSSTVQGNNVVFNASSLTDGVTSSNGFVNGQGAATNVQPNPWMMIDLGKQLTNISKINIYTRDDVPNSTYTTWCQYEIGGAVCAQPQFTVEIFATNPIQNGTVDPTVTPVWQSQSYTQNFDASQEPLTVNVPSQYLSQPGEFIVLNSSSPDASLQMTEIQVYQAQIPVITLSGSNPMYLATGGTFTDPGATAKDQNGNTINVTVSGTVDATTAGSYTLTYTATDSQGLSATPVTRTVNVQNGYTTLGG